MWLIDANKLLHIIMVDYGWDPWDVGVHITDIIDSLPTVKAIPKEFLEKKRDEYLELGLNTVAKELNVIITEWEKENEVG